MIAALQPIAEHLAGGKRRVAMATSVLERDGCSVVGSPHDDRLVQEHARQRLDADDPFIVWVHRTQGSVTSSRSPPSQGRNFEPQAARERSRAEPMYFMKFVGATEEMQRRMIERMIDIHPYTVEFAVR